MERISAKDHGSTKCPSVIPFEILNSEGPFEVASFEHFGLERPFNMAAMIVFTPKALSEGDVSRLECTVRFRAVILCGVLAEGKAVVYPSWARKQMLSGLFEFERTNILLNIVGYVLSPRYLDRHI